MKRSLVIFVTAGLLSLQASASDFSGFLQACGYGALIGAGAGIVSLAMENRPSEHYGSIARGASLGLYAGIAYGVYQYNVKPSYNLHNDYDLGTATIIVPKFAKAQVEGLEISSLIFRF